MAIKQIGTTVTDYIDILGLTPAQVNAMLAVTDKFGTTIDGALIQTVMMLLREANSTDVTAGISGLQGDNEELPAFWAGGTYQDAIDGIAKAIIRHDGTSKFTDTEITGTVNAKSGVVGGMSILQDKLFSKDERIEIDGNESAISIKDINKSTKILITPNDILPIDEYFPNASTYYKELESLNVGYINTIRSETLDLAQSGDWVLDDNILYDLYVTGFKIENTAKLLEGSMLDYVESIVRVTLYRNNIPYALLGTSNAIVWRDSNYGEPQGYTIEDNKTLIVEPRFMTIKGEAIWKIEVLHATNTEEENPVLIHTQANISNMTELAASKIINRSEIGANGMVIATSKENYQYMAQNIFEVRKSNIGFRVTASGVHVSNNMNAPYPTWEAVKTI